MSRPIELSQASHRLLKLTLIAVLAIGHVSAQGAARTPPCLGCTHAKLTEI